MRRRFDPTRHRTSGWSGPPISYPLRDKELRRPINRTYGGISSFDLYSESLRVTFTEDAGFDVPEGVEDAGDERKLTELFVTFTLGAKKFKDLKEKLSFIFKGFGSLVCARF